MRLLRRVEDVRVLAHSLRFRIFEALRQGPASPHELALRFGRKPTALYHHFARLERAKLIEVAERRQRRGAIERRYRPTASGFVVDRALARTPHGSRSVEAVLAAASTILQVTIEDLHAATLDSSRPLADATRSELGTLVARLTPARAKKVVSRLRALLADVLRHDGEGDELVRVTIAVLPVRREIDSSHTVSQFVSR